MVRSWVGLEKGQYERVKNLSKKTGRPVSGIIREAVSSFVAKKDYSISIGPSYLPKEAREDYRRVTAYFPRLDWDVLVGISQYTRRSKTDLIREAVAKYLAGVP